MKIVYMYETVILITSLKGERERDKLLSKGEVIERENFKPYLLIEENVKEKEGK